MAITLKKIQDYCDNDYIEDLLSNGLDENTLLITGNKALIGFGNEELREIVNTSYTELEDLKEKTGLEWEHAQLIGYDQNEWQDIYYVSGSISKENLKFIEAVYFGHMSGYYNELEEVCDYVPHYIEWEGKEAICKWLNLDPNNTIIEGE